MVERLQKHNRKAHKKSKEDQNNQYDKRPLHNIISTIIGDHPIDPQQISEVQQAWSKLHLETPWTTFGYAENS